MRTVHAGAQHACSERDCLIWRQDLGLAVRAFRELLDAEGAGAKNGSADASCALVLAGGYDARLAENREHYAELQALVAELGLQGQARLPYLSLLEPYLSRPGTLAPSHQEW